MSAAVVFLLFFICLIIAIPISIALGIVSVLPGAFDPSLQQVGHLSFVLCLEELIVSHYLQFQCLYYLE